MKRTVQMKNADTPRTDAAVAFEMNRIGAYPQPELARVSCLLELSNTDLLTALRSVAKQADAALALERDPRGHKEALQSIRKTALDALAEMKGTGE